MSGKVAKRTSPISRATASGGCHAVVHARAQMAQERHVDCCSKEVEVKEGKEDCIVCTEEIKRYATFANCGHAVCWLCALRMMITKKRVLHRCCYCKRGSKKVVVGARRVGAHEVKSLQTIPCKGTGVHCLDQESHDKVTEVTMFVCRICDRGMYDYAQFTAHTRRAHGLSVCDVCVRNRPLFIMEHQLFTAKELNAHISTRHRDRSEVNHGHPICYLCGKFNYDGQALLSHVQSKHVMCGLCDRNGTEWVFFKDVKCLLQHCRAKHALCEPCASAGMYDHAIFPTPTDLTTHERTCPTSAFYPPHRPSIYKSHPTGLRLLMSPNGWAMERPSGWSISKLNTPHHTSQWLSAQLRSKTGPGGNPKPARQRRRR